MISYFCYWKRQQRIIFGKVPDSVARSTGPCGFGYWGEIGIGWWESGSGRLFSFVLLVSSRGQCWAASWRTQDAAFQENAYKDPINCQELPLLLQVSCNLQDSVTQEVSCGFTDPTAISLQKCSVWCTFRFCGIKQTERAFLDALTVLPWNVLLQIIMILNKWFFVIFCFFELQSRVCVVERCLWSMHFGLLCSIPSIFFSEKNKVCNLGQCMHHFLNFAYE